MAYRGTSVNKFPIYFITKTLEIEPTNTYKKGDVIARPFNRKYVTLTQILSILEIAWELSTGYQESYEIKEQLDQTLR
ncbi:DUF4279 domain-containing protein [Sporosarcina sp. A2]|uniref:DUF4279 domain-containing protein n=1 Tax=Sporosarcina sp. A2 TaxID=3393449 RepID=UPI003D7A19F0